MADILTDFGIVAVDVAMDLFVDDGIIGLEVEGGGGTEHDEEIVLALGMGAAAGRSLVMQASVAFAMSGGMSRSSQMAMGAQIDMGITADVLAAGNVEFSEAVALAALLGDSAAAALDLMASISLTVVGGATAVARAEFNTSMTLAALFDLDATADAIGAVISESVNFDLLASASVDLQANLIGTITLPASFAGLVSGQSVLQASGVLSMAIGMGVVRRIVMQAGIDLGLIQSMSMTATRIAANVRTSDGRRLRVSVSTRSLRVVTEDRALRIGPPSRSVKPEDN